MANIRSFPNNQDEYIGAEDVMRWLHGRTSGVFGADGNAAVAPVLDAMAVTVSDGVGWIANENADGVVWWINDEAETGSKLQLSVDMADAVFTRIDRVVVSWQTTNYVALPEVTILKGVPASNPVAPALTNNSILRQISLASIRIPAGSTAITAAMITDERLDESVCGLVVCGVGIDTSVMQAQFESFRVQSQEQFDAFWSENQERLEKFWGENITDFETYMNAQKNAWENFLASLEDDILPVPAEGDAGKVVVVNPTNDGYILGDAQMKIPVTSEVPADSDVWIDPGEPSVELGDVVTRKLLWENDNPDSEFTRQILNINIEDFDTIEVVFRESCSDNAYKQIHKVQAFKTNIGFGSNGSSSLGYLEGTNGSRSLTMRPDKNTIAVDDNYTDGSINNIYTIPVRIHGIKTGSIPCNSGNVSPNGFTLTDQTTGKNYKIFVADGELTLEEV